MKEGVQFHSLYMQRGLPVFQNRMYDSEAEAKACPTGDVVLVEDLHTGLVYNAAFDPEVMVYDTHYQNEQATSPVFHAHLASVSRIIIRCMGGESVVEVGCGKGYFLEMLLANGVDITGFDPAYEGHNPRVVKQYFGPSVGLRSRGLVLRHVLEHVQDPYTFLQRLKEANGGTGKIYIEVPLFDWICERRAWFDVFYEHVNYFRIADFHRMFGSVLESGRLFGGQYLYAICDLATLREPAIDLNDRVAFPSDFTKSLVQHPAIAKQAAVWGGASKGVIFALLLGRTGQKVTTVIDINPAKQGKYLPATGLCVQSPREGLRRLSKGSTIYVMNSNYLDEIMHMSNGDYSYVTIDNV